MENIDKEYKKIIEASSEIEMPEFSADKAWGKLNSQLSGEALQDPAQLAGDRHAERSRSGRRVVQLKRMLKVAAVVVFGVLLGVLGNKYFSKQDRFVEVTAREGQKIDIKLPDGNKIWINSGSTVKYPANYQGFNKQVYISGEAYLEIADQGFSPLSVIVNDAVLQCFEGAFNVKTTKGDTEVTVASGWVTLNNPTNEVEGAVIEEGYTCFFNTDLPFVLGETDNVNYLAWKTGVLSFKGMPLVAVGKTLSEYYKVNVKVQGEMQYCKFTSEYKNTELNTILNDIEQELNSNIKQTSHEVFISGDDC